MSGFIKLPRTVFQLNLWTGIQRFSPFEAYVDLLRRATYHSSTIYVGHRRVQLEPGQILCSGKSLAEAWNWPVSTVRKFLGNLCRDGYFVPNCESGVTILTICNQAPAEATGELSDSVWSEPVTHSKSDSQNGREYNNNSKSDLSVWDTEPNPRTKPKSAEIKDCPIPTDDPEFKEFVENYLTDGGSRLTPTLLRVLRQCFDDRKRKNEEYQRRIGQVNAPSSHHAA
jgi:hypothetical protein